MQFIMIDGVGYGPPIVGTFVDFVKPGGDVSPLSVPAVPFGAESADRLIVLAVHYFTTEDVPIIDVTIGGVTATIHDQIVTTGIAGNAGEFDGLAFVSALVPTGLTGTVVVTNSSGVFMNILLGIYSVTGSTSVTLVDSDTLSFATTGGAPQSVAVDAVADGCVFAGLTSFGAFHYAETGITQQYDEDLVAIRKYSGGFDNISVDESGRIITFDDSGLPGSALEGAIVAISLR